MMSVPGSAIVSTVLAVRFIQRLACTSGSCSRRASRVSIGPAATVAAANAPRMAASRQVKSGRRLSVCAATGRVAVTHSSSPTVRRRII
jgi:hypothetical protein